MTWHATCSLTGRLPPVPRMTQTPQYRPALHLLILMGYVALGWLGLLVAGPRSDYAVALWPASGLGLASLLWLGRGVWPTIFAGGLITMFAASANPVWSLVMAAGLATEAIVGGTLVERTARGTAAFLHPNTIFRAVIVIAAVSAPMTATLAACASIVFGSAEWTDGAQLWMTWWLAIMSGSLVAAPLLLVWSRQSDERMGLLPLIEAVVILTAVTTVAVFVFGGRFPPTDIQNYPIEFLCVPFLLWAAFRQGRRTVSLAATILCGVAAWGTMQGFGPFVRENPYETVLLLQAYVAVTATMAVVIAAVVTGHRRAEAQLLELATTDPLTGLANYRKLLEVLRAEVARANRTSRPFSVLFLDVNGLKEINDRHGHLAGSRALCRVAEALRTSCRTVDTATRFGGDEFAVVLPETSEAGGYVLLRRLSERLARINEQPAVSVSGGVAVFPRDGASPTLLLRAADRVLYSSRARAAVPPHQTASVESFEERRTGTLF